MQFSPYGLSLGFNDITVNRLLKRLPEVLNSICNILTDNGALNSGYCPVCGNPLNESNSKKCNVDGFYITIENECVNTINTVIDADNKDFNEAPNNYLRGFLGAVIGGVVGAAVSILFYVIGLVSSIAAIVSIVLGAFLYRKFGGKPNAVMVLILSWTVFGMMILSVVGTYFVAAAIYAGDAGVSAIEYFKWCMQDEEIRRGFIVDMALTVLFTVLGCAYEIYMLWKRVKRQKNI